MDITIIALVSSQRRLGGVGYVNEDETTSKFAGSWSRTDGHNVSSVPIDDNIMSTSNGESLEQTSKFSTWVKGLGLFFGCDLKNLAQVEDLDVVVFGLGTNDEPVVQNAKLYTNQKSEIYEAAAGYMGVPLQMAVAASGVFGRRPR